MSNLSLVPFIALGLAMDSFAVSVSSGSIIKQHHINNTLKIALFFGFFQGIMPLLGWLIGISLNELFSVIDHWLAFCILTFIGVKMIIESKKLESDFDPLNTYILTTLALATSIDALAVGLSFSLLRISIIIPAVIIGVVTFVLSFFGVIIGKKFGHLFQGSIEIIGGIILVIIGLKILIQHLL
ncbi:MAG: manganese efflux pump MntP family protein [Patescibacteria group bacterium]|nr:manganese efflux pump MntP family protein [Patescibacteria group bacterium]